MTSDEYKKLVAAGKIKPVSAQKKAATKRKALEQSATVNRTAQAAYVDLIRVDLDLGQGVTATHWINPAYPELLEEWRGYATRNA